MQYQSENKICQNCKNDFVIEPDDFSFYEKIKVPPPTFCPDCRFKNRQKLLQRIISRASSGLYFIDENKKHISDLAWSRSIQILFSFFTELVIKSMLILDNLHYDNEDILNDLKTHNFELLIKNLNKKVLKQFKIKQIRKIKENNFLFYEIIFIDDYVMKVPDFIDIRYDFNKEELRSIGKINQNILGKDLKKLLEIIETITSIAFKI